MAASLSFTLDEDEGQVDEVAPSAGGEGLDEKEKGMLLPKKKVAKNPDVDTSHLPDRGACALCLLDCAIVSAEPTSHVACMWCAERDEALAQQRRLLREEWLAQQEVVKQQVRGDEMSWTA